MGYFNWTWFTGPSWTRISRVPDWHSWGNFFMSMKQKWPSNVRRINWIVTITFLMFQLETWFWCQTICFQYLVIQLNTSSMANLCWSYWFSKWLPFAHIIYPIFCYFSTRRPNFGLKFCFQYKIILLSVCRDN